MSEKLIYICDKCQTERTGESPKWGYIEVSFDGGNRQIMHDLCSSCLKGLIKFLKESKNDQ